MESKSNINKIKKEDFKPVYGRKLPIDKTKPLTHDQIKKKIADMKKIIEKEETLLQAFASINTSQSTN